MRFGRLDSDYFILNRVLAIDNQDTVPGMVYDQMQQLVSVDLLLTRAQYIRVNKTLLLKRVQDVYEKEKSVRPDHYIRIARNIRMLAPLAETLSAIGAYHSNADDVLYHVVQPDLPAQPPEWWNVDPALIVLWNQMMGRMAH